jgi:hypothetical protein
MDSLELLTPRAIDDCSLRRPTIFYRLLTRRTIYDTLSTAVGTREAPSMLRVNDGMRTRSAAGRSTTGIMASQLGARPPELSRQRPPNFKVSNVDKYEPKQDPGGWLAVYTTAARPAGASKDVMTAYLLIVLGQDALQWLRHLPRHCIDN